MKRKCNCQECDSWTKQTNNQCYEFQDISNCLWYSNIFHRIKSFFRRKFLKRWQK